MKKRHPSPFLLPALSLLGLFVSLTGKAQPSRAGIIIQIPTIEQEATQVWRTINDIAFFESQGYEVALPRAPLIDTLIAKSKAGRFGNDDFPAIYALLDAGVYDTARYENARQKVLADEPIIDAILTRLAVLKADWDWEFKLFDDYAVVFTLYGSGGGYDPDTGTITLFTTPDGGFKNYASPANTIVHEITHIGLENSIVQKHALPHGLKERVVDRFVYLLFRERLPQYRVQNMGDPGIDVILAEEDDLRRLDELLGKWKNN